MQSIVVDAGNSKVVIARCDDSRGAGSEQWQILDRQGTPDSATQLQRWTEILLSTVHALPTPFLVLSSVVPELTARALTEWPDVFVIDHTITMPFSLGMDEPATVGADRFCNMAAAVQRGWTDALVVDAGTATTFDLLDDGHFKGGLIAPGMAFSAEMLGHEAARLQPVAFESTPLEVGRSTSEAMRNGAFHVGINGVVTTIEKLLERYGRRPVVITGGLGHFLQQSDWVHEPHWTLFGALYLAHTHLAGS